MSSNFERILSETALKIGVVGIGNAGSQVAAAAAAEGHQVYIMNTSVRDLDDRVVASNVKSYQIGDGRGSGKNRENAVALLKMNGKQGIVDIFENPHFKATVADVDVVIVCFSTGGGTGSGIGPYLAEIIKKAYPNTLVIPYGILPKLSESIIAQSNTIACVDDMAKMNTSYMLADLEFYSDMPMEKAYAAIGKHVANTISTIRGDFLGISRDGMADERDMMTVISEPGYLAIHMADGITESKLSNKTIQGHMIDQIKTSPTCRIQRDGLVVYNLIITNTNSAINDAVRTGDYTELNAYIGEPMATFGNYAVDDDRSAVQCISVMSGLTIPMDRFAEPKAKIAENKAKFEKQSSLNLSDDRETNTISASRGSQSVIMNSGIKAEADLSFLDI